MKRFLFVFIVCIILNAFSGCTNKKDPKIEHLQEYFAAEKAAKNSPQTITKIFLDFEFGMSPQEVKDHFNSLKKAGKIHTDRGGFYYIYHTKYGDAKMRFSQAYHNDSLYSLKCSFARDGNLIDNRELSTLDAFSKFSDAHPDWKSWIVELLEGFDPDWYKIKDNVIVKFDMLRGEMTYTNAPVLKQIEEEKEQREQNTLNDF